MIDNHIADQAARLTLEEFDSFNSVFRTITRRARQRFEEKDWLGSRQDAAERIDSYERALDNAARGLEALLGELAGNQQVWTAARGHFASLVADRYDIERAETFFNSVTRKMLHTIGINREVEFFYLHGKHTVPRKAETICLSYADASDTASMVGKVLADMSFRVPYENARRDAENIAREIDLYMWPIAGPARKFALDIVRAVFYRNKEAYIIGRIVAGSRFIPLMIPLTNGDTGIYVETVLLHESDANVLFSFAFSYFFVDLERYDALIEFLRSIMPRAELAELYTSLGYNRHGKTEFYRDLHRFVHVSKEQFIIAPGIEGAVMIAFTLPNYGFVLKTIKDRPCFLRSMNKTPKMITREEVRRRYDVVSHRDRAGRMVDTQEYENLRFRKKRFSEQLLGEFAQAARHSIIITDDYVILRHVYVQRKVVPLPLYIEREKDPEVLRRVLIDFGYFLKDIAASGVFPGDLFNTWNYGVTHWGRVVLYDYDDVLPIEQVRFREKPSPRNEFEERELEEEWITSTDEEFFLDEIERYSGLPHSLEGIFKAAHGDLYTLEFWNTLTGRLNSGEVFDVIPYDRTKRFRTLSIV
jgi:isocitrate dehydrogenase kinase/phosphatase